MSPHPLRPRSPGKPSAAIAQPTSARRVPELDGLRGAAILLVLVWHYAASALDVSPLTAGAYVKQALSLTWSGVDLFFVLSGFLIGGILIEHRDAPHYWSAFYVRRACRILPLYVAIVASAVAAVWLARWLPAIAWMVRGNLPLWSYLSFTQNLLMAGHNTFGAMWLNVTWSLAVEEQFYLCLPMLVRLVPPRALPFVILPLVVAAPLVRLTLVALHPYGGFASYVLLPARADALLLGVLAAWALQQPATASWLRTRVPALYAAFAVLVAGTALLVRVGPGINPERPVRLVSLVGFSWLALLYLAVLLLALHDASGPIAWLARRAWLRALGSISYGVYLIHQIVLGLAHTLLLDHQPTIGSVRDALVTLFALGLTLALATLSWRTMEKPIVRWGQSHRY